MARLEQRTEQIVLETDRHRVEGTVTLPREGLGSRLSDFINQRDRAFLTVSDATIRSLDSDDARELPFVLVAGRHVRLVTPVGSGR